MLLITRTFSEFENSDGVRGSVADSRNKSLAEWWLMLHRKRVIFCGGVKSNSYMLQIVIATVKE